MGIYWHRTEKIMVTTLSVPPNPETSIMLKRKTAFTLIELLVVISIIALLIAILMPALNKARKQARASVCLANLSQWGKIFFMYTSDNEDKFWTEHNVWATGLSQGNWMPMLSKIYGDVDEFRLCPSAVKINGNNGGIGTAFKQWGGEIMINHQFGPDQDKNFGSYGINLWINSVEPPSTMGWRGQPERHWKKLQSKFAGDIPIVGDCTWFGANPTSLNDGPGGQIPPYEDYFEQMDPLAPNWGVDMARFCLNRHSGGINLAFMDCSTRKVNLNDLWSLPWHRGYERNYDVYIPWLD